jgi:sulfite exporter TauE/SafE
MAGIHLLPVFLVGLAGSVHCIGMCGGIVGALSAAQPARRVVPILPTSTAALALPAVAIDNLVRVLAYNGGRLASYAAAGAMAGGLAGSMADLVRFSAWQGVGYWLASLMLVALGLYLMDAWRGLRYVEALGGALWRRLQPALRPLLPMDSPYKALAAGILWGWLPCGMVYSMLVTALLSGSAVNGAAVMLAFGAGTLPMLLSLGLLGARLRQLAQRPAVRRLCGLLVLAFGVLGLMRASGLGTGALHALGLMHAGGALPGWLNALCVGGPL